MHRWRASAWGASSESDNRRIKLQLTAAHGPPIAAAVASELQKSHYSDKVLALAIATAL
jgi:hypothetical protein